MSVAKVVLNPSVLKYHTKYLLKPKVLLSENLEEINKYWVISPKLDGVRGILTLTTTTSSFDTGTSVEEESLVSNNQSVLDVEKIGEVYYILDVLAVNNSPVLHKTLFGRLESIDKLVYESQGYKFQTYDQLEGLNLQDYLTQIEEGVVLQDPSLTYDPYSNFIYRIKKEETIDVLVQNKKISLVGKQFDKTLDVDDGIYECDQSFNIIRKRLDKSMPNSVTLYAHIYDPSRVTLSTFQRQKFGTSAVILPSVEFDNYSPSEDALFDEYHDEEDGEVVNHYFPNEDYRYKQRCGIGEIEFEKEYIPLKPVYVEKGKISVPVVSPPSIILEPEQIIVGNKDPPKQLVKKNLAHNNNKKNVKQNKKKK